MLKWITRIKKLFFRKEKKKVSSYEIFIYRVEKFTVDPAFNVYRSDFQLNTLSVRCKSLYALIECIIELNIQLAADKSVFPIITSLPQKSHIQPQRFFLKNNCYLEDSYEALNIFDRHIKTFATNIKRVYLENTDQPVYTLRLLTIVMEDIEAIMTFLETP